MTMPSDRPIFEVRATRPDGSRRRLGLYATEADAAAQALLWLATGDAPRVETIKRVQGRVEVVSVLGRRQRFDERRSTSLS